MSLSGYDSEAVGFESISQTKREETSSGTQTSEFEEAGVGSQTNYSADVGSMVTANELDAQDDILKEYPPPGLNEFLRRVVPSMLEQLDENDMEQMYNSSDSEEDEAIQAKLIQEIKANTDMPGLGSGDHQTASILSLSWSSGGNSLCAALGQASHDRWCEHEGLLRVYSLRSGDTLQKVADIADRSCVTVVRYHPSVAAVLAYGTSAGEVVLCDLRDSSSSEGTLTSPSDCHNGRSVTALLWADAALANVFLTMQIHNTGRRRGASDQVLISAGSDGTVNVWQVNVNTRIFENVVSYALNSNKKDPAPDISCFDFVKSYPLRPTHEKIQDDVFVVGTTTGGLLLCGVKGAAQSATGALDPVRSALEPHGACVLNVVFSSRRPEVFTSLAGDAELRVYRIDQPGPLKVFCLDAPMSCMTSLPGGAYVAAGVARGKQLARVLCATSGRRVRVDGLEGTAHVTALAVTQTGTCRIACGDADATLRVWELPTRRLRLAPEDLDF